MQKRKTTKTQNKEEINRKLDTKVIVSFPDSISINMVQSNELKHYELFLWLVTILAPIAAVIISFVLYHLIGFFIARYMISPQKRSFFIFWGLIFAGCFGAYALGSNNVANVTGVYVGSGLLTPFEGALIGSLSIASGVLTYSKKVMMTVGKEITPLDEYAAFVAALSGAITVEVFTQVGVPVSSSQAIVGGVAGVGLVKGARTVNKRTVAGIGIAWISTPISAGIISYVLLKLFA